MPEPRHRPTSVLWVLLPLAAAGAGWLAFHVGALPDERFFVEVSAADSDWLLAVGACLAAASGVVLPLVRRRRTWRRRLEEQAGGFVRDRRLPLARPDHELKNPLTAMRAALANVSAEAVASARWRRGSSSGTSGCGAVTRSARVGLQLDPAAVADRSHGPGRRQRGGLVRRDHARAAGDG